MTLFPYTTLFRSRVAAGANDSDGLGDDKNVDAHTEQMLSGAGHTAGELGMAGAGHTADVADTTGLAQEGLRTPVTRSKARGVVSPTHIKSYKRPLKSLFSVPLPMHVPPEFKYKECAQLVSSYILDKAFLDKFGE